VEPCSNQRRSKRGIGEEKWLNGESQRSIFYE
jgi:hypothetical protein